MSELYERVVREAMERLRLPRKKAERAAEKLMKRTKPQAVARKLDTLNRPMEPAKLKNLRLPDKQKKTKSLAKPKQQMTRAEIMKLPPVHPPQPPPKNAKERIERALGPDDGRRRRGGSPTVQGGSPGLGKRS